MARLSVKELSDQLAREVAMHQLTQKHLDDALVQIAQLQAALMNRSTPVPRVVDHVASRRIAMQAARELAMRTGSTIKVSA